MATLASSSRTPPHTDVNDKKEPCALAGGNCKDYSKIPGDRLCTTCAQCHPYYMTKHIGNDKALEKQLRARSKYWSKKILDSKPEKTLYSGICCRGIHLYDPWLAKLFDAREEQIRRAREERLQRDPTDVRDYHAQAGVKCSWTHKQNALCDLCFNFVVDNNLTDEAWYVEAFDGNGHLKAAVGERMLEM